MSSASSPIDRATPASTAPPAPAIAPLSFLRRLAELTNVPHDPAAMAAADEHTAAQPTWQQTLELQCAPLGLQSRRVVWSMRAFDIVYLLTRGGPGEATVILSYFVFTKAFEFGDLGAAAAVACLLAALTFAITCVYLRVLPEGEPGT